MAPKKNKKTIQPKQTQTLRAHESGEDAAIDYAAVQDDEIEALKAIFMEDFEEIAAEKAWNKTTEHRFKLKIGAFSDTESAIDLSVRLTATYPKTVPLLHVSGLDAFHERTQTRVQQVLTQKPKQLVGEVMIHALATEIQEILEDAVQARQQGTLPSLDDERANAEEAALLLAKQAEETQKKLVREAQEEERRVLDQMVEEELGRREKRKTKHASDIIDIVPKQTAEEVLQFDQTSTCLADNQEAKFSAVSIVSRTRTFSIAKPITAATTPAHLVAIHIRTLRSSNRADVEEVESTLDRVRRLRHRNVQRLHLFRLDRQVDKYDTISSMIQLHSADTHSGSWLRSVQISSHAARSRNLCLSVVCYHPTKLVSTRSSFSRRWKRAIATALSTETSLASTFACQTMHLLAQS